MSISIFSELPLLNTIIKTNTIKTDHKFLKDILQVETKLTYNDKRLLKLNISNLNTKQEEKCKHHTRLTKEIKNLSRVKTKIIKRHSNQTVRVEVETKPKFKEKTKAKSKSKSESNSKVTTKDDSISKTSQRKKKTTIKKR